MTDDAPPASARRTRAAIVQLLESSPTGMTVAELARSLSRHPNAVRKQMDALVREGSVGARREASGRRGRPAVRYRAADAGREAAATRRLAHLLVELVAEIGPDEALVEEFGRRRAAGLAATSDGRTALIDQLTAMGFAPRETTTTRASRAGELEVVLGHCPFRDAVQASGGALVCVLHRGISRGLVELSPAGRLTGFEAQHPEGAGCRIAASGLRTPDLAARA